MSAIQSAGEQALANPADFTSSGLLFDFSLIENMNKLANMMATSRIAVPRHFQGQPGDCLAVVMQSAQWGMNPYAVAQKCFNVNGVLGYEAQLVAAVINTRAPTTGRLQYRWDGPWEKILGKFSERESKTKKDDNGYPIKYKVPAWKLEDEEGLSVTVSATLKGESEPRALTLLMTQARTRNSTLWAEDPKQQLAYLASKRWARLHCPDVLLGVYTPDELDEPRQPAERDMGKVEDVRKEDPPATASRASRAKDKLHSRAAQATDVPATDMPVGAPDLDEVLGAIGAATNSAELTTAGQMASKMPDGPDKDRARKAYQDKLQAGKAASAPAEPAQSAGQEDTLTFAQVMDALQNAANVDALNLAADLIRYVPDMVQQDELRAQFERLKAGDN